MVLLYANKLITINEVVKYPRGHVYFTCIGISAPGFPSCKYMFIYIHDILFYNICIMIYFFMIYIYFSLPFFFVNVNINSIFLFILDLNLVQDLDSCRGHFLVGANYDVYNSCYAPRGLGEEKE